MADAMTLEEALAAVRAGPTVQEACLTMSSEARVKYERGVAVLRAHAERTLAAREGEPDKIRAIREGEWPYKQPVSFYADAIIDHIDALTAENAALRAERDALRQETWLARMLTETERERNALRARVERLAGALRDIMAAYEYELNDGDLGADNYYLVEDIDAICRRALEGHTNG